MRAIDEDISTNASAGVDAHVGVNGSGSASISISTSTSTPTSTTPIPRSRFSFSMTGDLYDYPPALLDLIHTFRTHYHMPDASPLLAAISAVIGHQISGAPIWLMLVGPPSCGKTAIIESLCGLPDTHHAAALHIAGLLSGTSRKDTVAGSTGGLLKDRPSLILLLKEFSSVLSLGQEERRAVMAALREIYDGRWSRSLGVDNGREISWAGRMSLISGCTPTIDSHYAVIGAMGERFMFYRFPRTNPSAIAGMVAQRVNGKSIDDNGIQLLTQKAVNRLYANLPGSPNGCPPRKLPHLTPAERTRLVGLALVCCRCRSVVERDSYTHEVTNIYEPESPGRYTAASIQLYAGLKVMGVPERDRWNIVGKIALDSMPAIRRQVLDVLTANYQTPLTTQVVNTVVQGYSETTLRRVLEDLYILRVAQRGEMTGGTGKARDLWQLTEGAVSDFRQAFPNEMENDESKVAPGSKLVN